MTPDPESTPVTRTEGDQPGQAETFPASVGGVSVLVITALAVLSQLYAAIPLLVPVGTALGGSTTFALSTAYGLCYALGFLLWGPIADRYGRRRVMITGLACLVVTTFGCGLASSLPLLAVLRGAQGLMASSLPPRRAGLPQRGRGSQAPGDGDRSDVHRFPRRWDRRADRGAGCG